MIDISDGASVRNLEKIQEDSPQGGSGKGATFALVVLSGACLLFATMAFGGRKTSTPSSKKIDPLAELATKASTSPTILPGEVTFPGILSDKANPATAMAAATAGIAGSVLAPPPAGDKLPVVPLPARHTMTAAQLLGAPAPSIAPAGASTVAKPYKDKLSALAEGDPSATSGSLAPTGAEGGWQVQVSSFKTAAEADVFANKLRARGHKAHVQKAEIPNRGTWYRVKIGPFGTQNEAIRYRTSFEAKEKMPGFVLKSE